MSQVSEQKSTNGDSEVKKTEEIVKPAKPVEKDVTINESPAPVKEVESKTTKAEEKKEEAQNGNVDEPKVVKDNGVDDKGIEKQKPIW